MKLNRVNVKGGLFKHVVTHAPATPNTAQTYGARCSVRISGNKVVFAWRVFNRNGGKK